MSRGRRKGIYFQLDVLKMLEAYAKEVGLAQSRIVNIALKSFFSTEIKNRLKETIQLEAEREQLMEEEKRLFRELKVVLRSGVYLEKAQRELLLGMNPNEIMRVNKRQGIYTGMDDNQREAVMRIFERRRMIVNRLVEIEIKVLPKSKRTVGYGKYGKLEIIPKVSSEDFISLALKNVLDYLEIKEAKCAK